MNECLMSQNAAEPEVVEDVEESDAVDEWNGDITEGHSRQIDDDYDDSDSTSIHTTASTSTIRREKPSLVPNESTYTFNPTEYLVETLNGALDSLEYDQSLVVQSKMAGELNNSSNEVLKTISDLRNTITEHVAKYELLQKQVLPEIAYNLRKASQRVKQLTTHARETYPVEFARARARVLENITSDEEGVYL
jgi:hypothetical protein